MDKTAIERNNDHMTEYDKRELDQSDMSTVLDSLTDSTPMKKMLLTDSSVLPCSEKDSPFPKEYEIFLDSLTDFRSNSSNTINNSNLSIKIHSNNDPNNVDSFNDVKTQETNVIRDGLSVGAQPLKEMESDNPPILDLGDEIVFQNIKSFADIDNEVDKSTDFSNEMAFDSSHTEQGHLQNNHIPSLKTSEKPSKTDQNDDPNDLDLDLLCEVTLDVTGVHNDRLVDNLINGSEERLNTSEMNCAAAQLNKNATATSSVSGCERQSEFQMKLDKNSFEAIELTLDFGTPAEKIVTDKKTVNLDKLHSCEICNKKFSEPSYLLRHLKSHTGEFTCVMCLRVFARKESLENHTCSDVSVFRCKLCNCVFKTKRDMKNHLKQHTNEEKPNDKETWSKLSVKKVLDRSQALLSPDSTEKIHDLETSQLLDCKEDSVTYSKKEYVCELCGAHYKSSRGLSYHRLTHSSDKQLTCYVCDKKFHRKSVLDNHISGTHLNLKKSCPICKMLLTGEKSLRRHMKRHTVQQQKFKCHACDKTFLQKINLSKHMRIKHQGNEKPDNGKETARNTAPTQKDILKSSDNQPPQRRNKTGNRRKKSQNKNEEYICRYCHTILNNRNSLNRHLRVKHQDSRKEWSVPEVVDSMRVVVEEAAEISTAVPVSHQVDLEPILAVAEADENMMVTNDPESTDIQPTTSDTAENTSDPIDNQLCPLDYAFTLKTENNQESDVIGYQPLMQPLNASELFQLEGNDNTPALILDDSSVIQSGIQLDKELFYLVFTSEPETKIPS
ncbi:hypothetical protein LSTR_LSTR010150 [Laodelphax striatellus]|uniref:C2H2-type domain-containing protein n=1 Tax=Laodelphax striatellus TaxID=195883 RepID=A0A482WJ12_LAOST|nr:hypothetical protein LSTR_LSTR010150 [Laodelphax striatellus]